MYLGFPINYSDLNEAMSDLRVKGKHFSEKDIWKMLYFLSQVSHL